MKESYQYVFCGLGVHSSVRMPELPEQRCAADVVVRHGTLTLPTPDALDYPLFSTTTPEGAYFFWKSIGGMRVTEGREIVVDLLPGIEDRTMRHAIMGMGMGMALHQRGYLVLHASAVAVDGQVATFIGVKGAGKSTMAAALHRRGHPLVTDDLLVFAPGESGRVLPSFPQLKLWPQAARSLGDDPGALPRLHPQGEKRARRAEEGFQQDALPLRCIYVLDYVSEEQPVPIVEPFPPQEAFVELIRHSYALRLIGKEGSTPAHLRQCTELIQTVPVRRLVRERSLSALSEVAAQVEEDLAGLGTRSHKKAGLVS